MSGGVKLVEIGWRQYAEKVLPSNAPRVQMWECRRAFYAGAMHLFSGLVERVGSSEDVEDADMDLMAGVSAEIEQFNADVLRGRK